MRSANLSRSLLNNLSHRLPARHAMRSILFVCAFPTHFWAYLVLFHESPAFLYHSDRWEVISLLAYTQVYVLLETLFLWALLVFVAFLMPGRFFRDHFTVKGTIFVLVSAIWVATFQFKALILDFLGRYISLGAGGKMILLGVWVVSYFVVFFGALSFLKRSTPFERLIDTFVERISLLSIVYLSVDLIGLLIVIIRNIMA